MAAPVNGNGHAEEPELHLGVWEWVEGWEPPKAEEDVSASSTSIEGMKEEVLNKKATAVTTDGRISSLKLPKPDVREQEWTKNGKPGFGTWCWKKQKGKPKDPEAPKKPLNAYSRFANVKRQWFKENKPEVAADMGALGKAIAEAWQTEVSQEEKDRLAAEAEKELEIWRPKFEEYKATSRFKQFFEVRQDWIDKRKRKFLGKKMNKDAPKKPPSGYMRFASEVRQEVMKECEGLPMGEIGKRISARWAEVSEAKKAKYSEEAESGKIEWQKKFAEYQKGEGWKNFVIEKAKMEAQQDLKKIGRVNLDEAPKKAPSAALLFKKEKLTTVQKEFPDLAKDLRELNKKLGVMWNELPEGQKGRFFEMAENKKKEYLKKLEEFKVKQKYTAFLTNREKIKVRENKRVNLWGQPKRPRSAFALYANEHKDEVPQGKGEGKGRSALKVKWEALTSEEQKKYLDESAKSTESWRRDVDQFKEGEGFKKFESNRLKISKEYKDEGMKVMTLRFLREAPEPPPKTPFLIYFAEHKAESGGGRAAFREWKEKWNGLDRTVRKEFEDKRVAMIKEYEGKVKEFMEGEQWKEYVMEAKKLRIPVKKLLLKKKLVIKKIKKGDLTFTIIPAPPKPDAMPKKGPSAYRLFCDEKKKEVENASELEGLWKALSPEDKKKYQDKAKELDDQYQEELTKFNETDEGKTYQKEIKQVNRRRKVTRARETYLRNMPKKPGSAKLFFEQANRKELKFKGQKVSEAWGAMSAEERKPYEDKAHAAAEKYNGDMSEFKQGEDYQKFLKAIKIRKVVKTVTKKKGVKKVIGIPAPVKPESMPKKPQKASAIFAAEHPRLSKKEQAEKWVELSGEDRAKYTEQATAQEQKYDEEYDAWKKSEDGKKYERDFKVYQRRKAVADAKKRYLSNVTEPPKPTLAVDYFRQEKLDEIQKEFPDLKGLMLRHKATEKYKALSSEEKQPYEDKAREAYQAWEKEMEEYKSSAEYKNYDKAMNRISGKGKPKAKAKAKGPPKITGPEKPANMPKAPPVGHALFLFRQAELKKGTKLNGKEANEKWLALGAEGQKEFQDEAKAYKDKYDADMIEFAKTAEGKKYFRESQNAKKKKLMSNAKEKLKAEDAPKEPKKPVSAWIMFGKEKGNDPSFQGLDLAVRAKKLQVLWNDLPKEEKDVFDKKAAADKERYDQEMAEYKKSDAFKSYAKAVKALESKPKKKAPKRAAKPAKPEKPAKAPKAKAKAGSKKKADSDSDSDDQMGSVGSDSDSSSSDSDSD
eukprot:gnl/MRDRNA2_/MRDRNA2_90560_c0_seq1.p1 gnl/MRDRNA2_/MRDRNA2_90560_c0~~gnl/MRDRNA2_/MRDRNA2_90560_c0_seq1.p1  ORF type:complete len:1266 (-),score=449.97 gnl/MRDRNA2_/MRDRNA2_90560_c0_seq1:43-3840(-)